MNERLNLSPGEDAEKTDREYWLKPSDAPPPADPEHPFRGMTEEDYHLGVAEAHTHAANKTASVKTLIKRSRESTTRQLKGLGDQQEALQIKIAAAKTARDAMLARAAEEYAAAMADINADLYQITETRAALELAHGHLTKAEL